MGDFPGQSGLTVELAYPLPYMRISFYKLSGKLGFSAIEEFKIIIYLVSINAESKYQKGFYL
jgi:hypothetical protein